MSRTVIFGAAGFVGRNMVESLRKQDKTKFLATDFVKSPFSEDVEYVELDIQDSEQVEKVVEPGDVILHLAASSLLASMQNPARNMRINVGGTLNILDAAREKKASRLIFSSASSVVGTVNYNPVDERHPCTPKSPYAAAKKACEDYIRIYHEMYGLNYLVFRFFNVYGPYQYPVSGGLIPKLYSTLKSRASFTVFGDGSTSRDFIYVGDIVNLLLRAVEPGCKVVNELVNLGTGTPTTVLELVNKSGDLLKVSPNLEYKPKRLGEIDNFVADISKLKNLFDWVPPTTLEKGLKKTFRWLKENSEQ